VQRAMHRESISWTHLILLSRRFHSTKDTQLNTKPYIFNYIHPRIYSRYIHAYSTYFHIEMSCIGYSMSVVYFYSFDQIKRCKTDEFVGLEWNNPTRPEATNLLNIYRAVSGQSREDIEEQVKTLSWSSFKPLLADAVVEHLQPIQKKYQVGRGHLGWNTIRVVLQIRGEPRMCINLST